MLSMFLLSMAMAAVVTSSNRCHVAALATSPPSSTSPSKKSVFTEIQPLKAAMLTKSWQGLLLDVDQKVGIVPELGSTSVGVQRFGPELKRRTSCARQFERCYEAAFALAIADKGPSPEEARAKRLTIPLLLIDGEARGPDCKTFACLTSPATIAVVEQQQKQKPQKNESNDCIIEEEEEGGGLWWSVLMLIVNPTERNIDAIVEAERTMLRELCKAAMESNGSADGDGGLVPSLRILDKARETLAGDEGALGLSPLRTSTINHDKNNNVDDQWYRCELS